MVYKRYIVKKKKTTNSCEKEENNKQQNNSNKTKNKKQTKNKQKTNKQICMKCFDCCDVIFVFLPHFPHSVKQLTKTKQYYTVDNFVNGSFQFRFERETDSCACYEKSQHLKLSPP